MSDIQTFHDNLIKGKLNKLVFDEILYDNFCWIYDFSMLRHQHYALSWSFDAKEDIDDIALFCLIINKHDDKAKEIMNKFMLGGRKINFDCVLRIARMEWLPSASKDICRLLLTLFPDDASINYMVTSWSIMSNYDIPNLKYAYDHHYTYKSAGYSSSEITKHKYEIKVARERPYVKISVEDDYIFGDCEIRIGDTESFNRIWNELELDALCSRATCIEWNSSMDYDYILYNFGINYPNYELVNGGVV
jgi:hypothetical protein